MQYQLDRVASDATMRGVADYVSGLMGRLDFGQQDALWAQMKASPTLWGLLESAVSQGKPPPQFADSLSNADGQHRGNEITLNFATTVDPSDGGIGTVSTVLGHELTHLLNPAAQLEPDVLYQVATSAGATFESVARQFCVHEAVAFYASNVIRAEVMAYTPGISVKDFPKPIPVSIPDGLPSYGAAISSLVDQLVVPGRFTYRNESDAVYLAAQLSRDKNFVVNQDILLSFQLSQTSDGATRTLTWTGPDGRAFKQYFTVDAAGRATRAALTCTAAAGLEFQASLQCDAGLQADIALAVSQRAGSISLLGIQRTSNSESLPAWGNSYYDDFFYEGGELFQTEDSEAYLLSASGISSVRFGTGSFQENLYLAAGATIELDGSLDGEVVRLTRESGSLRMQGSGGQYVDLQNWEGAVVKLSDGTTYSLSALLGVGSGEVVLGSPEAEAVVALGGATVLLGAGGDDTLNGSAGDDTYVKGINDGNDTVQTGGGVDVLALQSAASAPVSEQLSFAREGLDVIVSLSSGVGDVAQTRIVDWFTPGSVGHQVDVRLNDAIHGRGGITSSVLHVEGTDDAEFVGGVSGYSDVIFGNGGDDTLDVSAGGEFKAADEVHGGDGNDVILGSNSNDFFYGDAGDDVIKGGTGNDHLEGGDGDDALYSDDGAAQLDGGAGEDFVFSQGSGASLQGGDGDDYVYAKGSQNSLSGGAGFDFMRTRGTNLTADGGADDDSLWDQGANNQLFGGAGNDYFQLEGAGVTAYGGAGSDQFSNFGAGTTLDGGADNDSYYSESSDVTVVMSASSGDDTLLMNTPTVGVLRLSGVFSEDVTSHIDGTSLVISTGTSSLTISNYILDGAVNPNLGGIQFDDKTVPPSDLPQPPPPDTSTIRGTVNAETLVGNGTAYRIIGMGGDDTLFGSGAPETFEWSEGDGLDTVWAQSSDLVSFEGSGYGVSAHRSGNDLTLSAGGGGGYFIPGWFTGDNRPSVRAPDGSIWSPSAIDSQFSDGVYDISYSTGVYRIEDALPMLLSYCPDLDGIALAGFNRANFNATPSILSDALPNSMWGEDHVDSAGQHYTSWSAPIVDDTFTDGLLFSYPYWGGITVSETSGDYGGGSYASARGSLQWDYWTDASGQGYIALTHASSSIQTGYQWVVPPTEESPNWSVGRWGLGTYTGPSASSVRQVEVLAPSVDSFVLYGSGSAGAMAMMAAFAYDSAADVGLDTLVTTGDVEVEDFPRGLEATMASAWAPTSGLPIRGSLSNWQSALQRIGEDVTAPAERSFAAGTAEASPVQAPEARVSTGFLAQPVFDPALGADPLAYFFRDSEGVPPVGTFDGTRMYIQPYPGTSNDFRLAA